MALAVFSSSAALFIERGESDEGCCPGADCLVAGDCPGPLGRNGRKVGGSVELGRLR